MLRKGTTLFELLTALALIAFIFSLSAYVFHVTDKYSVQHELNRLYAVMLFMQRKAQVEQKDQCLVFTTYGYDADQPYSLNKKVVLSSVTFPQRRIIFFTDGAISAGAVYFADEAKEHRYALTCDASEYRHIRRYRYDKEKAHWLLFDELL